MSLIPFILDLADELNEFNRCLTTGGGGGVGAMDIDDFGFGIYPHELQQSQFQQQLQMHHQQQLRRVSPRNSAVSSQLYWLPNLSNKQRHHPYYRSKACCNKTATQLHSDPEKEPAPANISGSGGDRETAKEANTGTGTKSTAAVYSVVNKNGGFQVSMNVKQFAPNELTVKTIDSCIVVEGQHEDKEDGHGVISRHFIRKYMLPKGYDPNEVLSTLSSDGILTVKAPPPPATKADEPLERIVDIQQTGPTHSSAKDSSKEQQQQQQQTKTATQQQQQQQQQQQHQKQEDLQKLPERNGEANSNDTHGESETEVEQRAVVEAAVAAASSSSSNVEEAMLVSNDAVNTTVVDSTTAAAAAVTTAGDEDANANITNNTNNMNIDNGIKEDENPTTIPVTNAATAAAVIAVIPNDDINAIVVVEIETIPEGADVGAADGVVETENEADGIDGISVGGVGVGVVIDDEKTGIENSVVGSADVVAAQSPTAADLVAAADAAILLTKTTQCGENGNKSANEEIAN